MVEGVTKSGFKFRAEKEMLEDAEFLEAFVAARNDNLQIFDLIEKALGKEQKKALYDHVRTQSGRVPINVLSDEVTDIFRQLREAAETKN